MARTPEEQTQSLANYLPNGKVWAAKNQQDTIIRGLLAGLSGELVRSAALIEEFREQIMPDRTVLFLDEWERALAIPDDCFTGTGTDDERRNDILAKLASLGVQTSEDMRLLALQVYGIEITIRNPARDPDNVFPFEFFPTGESDPLGTGGEMVLNLSDREARFQIIIDYNNLPTVVLFPFTFPLAFGTREVAIVECLLTQLRPANVGFTEDIPIPTRSPVPTPIPPVTTTGTSLYIQNTSAYGHMETTNSFDQFDLGFPAADGSFSMSVWARGNDDVAARPAGVASLIVGFGAPSVNQDNLFEMSHNVTDGVMFGRIQDETTGGDPEKHYQISLPTPATDEWFMFTMTYDGLNNTNSFKIYLNDQYDSTPIKVIDENISGLVPRDIRANIGANGNSGGGTGYAGFIHSVATWNKVLSASEVVAIYNGKEPTLFPLDQATVAYPGAANLKNWYLLGSNLTGTLNQKTDSQICLDRGPGGSNGPIDFVNEESGTNARLDQWVTDQFPTSIFARQIRSLKNFASVNEMVQTTPVAMGFIGTFSVSIWVKDEQTVSTGSETAFSILSGVVGNNEIQIGADANSIDNLRVLITDNAGASRQAHVWNNAIDGNSDKWHHYVLTWDGTVSGLKLYIDGIETAPTTTSANLDSSTITDPATRKIVLGGRSTIAADRWVGPIYSAAVWDIAVTQDDVTTLWNLGNARDVNALDISGGALNDYYRIGLSTSPGSFGLDYGQGDAVDRSLSEGALVGTDQTTDIPT